MTAKETLQYLIQDAGLDEATAAAVMKAAENEKVNTRASQLRQASEYQTLEQRAVDLQRSADENKNYREWYVKNYDSIKQLETAAARYKERYGDLDAPTQQQQQQNQQPQYDETTVAKLVDARIQSQYGPQWSNLLKGSGKLLEKHLRAGRKQDIDWDKVSEIAATKNGDLVAAYDEWDAPEREKSVAAAQEAEINKRVQAELKKRQTNDFFPAGADGSSTTTGRGSTSPLSRSGVTSEPKYDRNAVIQAAVTGDYNGNKDVVN